MNQFPDIKPRGAFSALLADQDLTHLERVLRRSLSCDLGGPLLPLSYWRERLASVTRQSHLSVTQIQIVDRLYRYIDEFEAEAREPSADADADVATDADPPAAVAGGCKP